MSHCQGTRHPNNRRRHRALARTPVRRPFVHPPPDSRGVATRFNGRGEMPNPAPGTRYSIGCGFPIYVELPRSLWGLEPVEVTLSGPSGPVKGYVSSPAAPADPGVWDTNSGLLLFVPEAPLEFGTTYQARFILSDDHGWEWSFTTIDG